MGIPALTDHLHDQQQVAGVFFLPYRLFPRGAFEVEVLVNPETHVIVVHGKHIPGWAHIIPDDGIADVVDVFETHVGQFAVFQA
jgi:hypothetical protein